MDADPRLARITRTTRETDITLSLKLDGTGQSEVATGIPFLDHMLDLFARHGLFDLEVTARGDTAVDYHHTVEDVGLVLGAAVRQAVGQKRGLCRYGFFLLPMDETLARVALDLSNRPILVYRVEAQATRIRDFDLHLVREFFRAFAAEAGANLHVQIDYGDDPHHMAEALFKAFARALDAATRIDPRLEGRVPSTKENLH